MDPATTFVVGAADAAFFATTTFGSDFLVVTEAFVTGTLVGATADLTGLSAVFATALLAGVVTFTGFFGTGFATTLLVFETALLVALFDDLVAAAILVCAAAFFVAGFTACALFFASEREAAGLTAFALVAEVLTVFLIAFAIGPSTKWVANAA